MVLPYLVAVATILGAVLVGYRWGHGDGVSEAYHVLAKLAPDIHARVSAAIEHVAEHDPQIAAELRAAQLRAMEAQR